MSSSDPVPSAASSALSELLEVSPQVDAAVILERDGGRLLASAPASSDRMADRFGATCVKLLAAAEQSRTELGREPVSQVEVATPNGHVFVVADATWVVAAVTDADPTVGLVFYDLKTALRTVREARAAAGDAAAATNGHVPASSPSLVTASGDDDADSPEQGSNRWRRKKS
jgi:predicted regulator of Ras-like GTPase activity (Roadblock/LC7/MglB family)